MLIIEGKHHEMPLRLCFKLLEGWHSTTTLADMSRWYNKMSYADKT